jgi:hypothetical protein
MPTTAGDIYVRSGTQGAFTEVKYVQGGWLTVDSSSTMVNIDVSRLQQGQLVFVESQNKFYKATVILADYITIFDDSASFSEYRFLTSSISNFDSEVSRSAAIAGFGSGGGSVPAGTVSSSAQTIANLNGTNILSGSILTSSVTNFDTEVSRSAAANGFGASTLPSGVVSSSAQVSYVLISNVPSGIVSSSTQTIANLNGSGILSGSSSVPAGTISGSQQITDLGFINQSQTSSMSVATASYVSPTFISASAAASGFGSSTLPSGVVSSSAQVVAALPVGTISSSAQILPILTSSVTNFDTEVSRSAATAGFGSSTLPSGVVSSSAQVISNLNGSGILSGSIPTSSVTNFDTEVSRSAAASGFGSGGGASVPAGTISSSAQVIASLPAGTVSSSAQILPILTSSVTNFDTEVSRSAAAAGFGSGGGSTDISALNTFTSSIQSEVNALKAATSSYVTSAQTSSFVTNSQTSSFAIKAEISGAFTQDSSSISTRLTSLEGTSGGDVTALNLFTSSIQTQVNNLTAETSSYLTSADTSSFITISQTSSMSVATASYVSPTFISASAAASGFGSTTLPSGVVSSSTQIVAALPAGTVSSSAQTVANLVGQNVVVNSITAQQYVVSSSVSFITTSFSSGSTAFGDSLSDTHTFTGSVSITGSLNIGGPFTVNNENLNVSSGSIILTNSSSIVVLDSGIISGTFVGNLNYNYITNLPNLISSSAQIAALGAGLLSSSAQIASDISGAFTSLSSSFASRITALEGAGGGSGIFTLTGSFYSTTNNVKITGSLSVGSGSFKSFEVDSNGFVVLGDMTKDLNIAPIGTIAYSGSNFYLIS